MHGTASSFDYRLIILFYLMLFSTSGSLHLLTNLLIMYLIRMNMTYVHTLCYMLVCSVTIDTKKNCCMLPSSRISKTIHPHTQTKWYMYELNIRTNMPRHWRWCVLLLLLLLCCNPLSEREREGWRYFRYANNITRKVHLYIYLNKYICKSHIHTF